MDIPAKLSSNNQEHTQPFTPHASPVNISKYFESKSYIPDIVDSLLLSDIKPVSSQNNQDISAAINIKYSIIEAKIPFTDDKITDMLPLLNEVINTRYTKTYISEKSKIELDEFMKFFNMYLNAFPDGSKFIEAPELTEEEIKKHKLQHSGTEQESNLSGDTHPPPPVPPLPPGHPPPVPPLPPMPSSYKSAPGQNVLDMPLLSSHNSTAKNSSNSASNRMVHKIRKRKTIKLHNTRHRAISIKRTGENTSVSSSQEGGNPSASSSSKSSSKSINMTGYSDDYSASSSNSNNQSKSTKACPIIAPVDSELEHFLLNSTQTQNASKSIRVYDDIIDFAKKPLPYNKALKYMYYYLKTIYKDHSADELKSEINFQTVIAESIGKTDLSNIERDSLREIINNAIDGYYLRPDKTLILGSHGDLLNKLFVVPHNIILVFRNNINSLALANTGDLPDTIKLYNNEYELNRMAKEGACYRIYPDNTLAFTQEVIYYPGQLTNDIGLEYYCYSSNNKTIKKRRFTPSTICKSNFDNKKNYTDKATFYTILYDSKLNFENKHEDLTEVISPTFKYYIKKDSSASKEKKEKGIIAYNLSNALKQISEYEPDKMIRVYVRACRGCDIPDKIRYTPFINETILTLINRYVAVREMKRDNYFNIIYKQIPYLNIIHFPGKPIIREPTSFISNSTCSMYLLRDSSISNDNIIIKTTDNLIALILLYIREINKDDAKFNYILDIAKNILIKINELVLRHYHFKTPYYINKIKDNPEYSIVKVNQKASELYNYFFKQSKPLTFARIKHMRFYDIIWSEPKINVLFKFFVDLALYLHIDASYPIFNSLHSKLYIIEFIKFYFYKKDIMYVGNGKDNGIAHLVNGIFRLQ